MPTLSPSPGQLITQLEAGKSRFDHGHFQQINVQQIDRVLSQLSRLPIEDPHHLIRFHECLLFLRAFPHSPSLLRRVENLLNNFHQRVEKIAAANADMSLFDDFDTSGIAGTTMQDILSFDVAQWLARRIPRNVDIAWNDYWDDSQAERSRGDTWPRFIPLLEEDAYAEANIPWQRWLNTARGRLNALPWFLRQFAKLPLPAPQQAELYDSLRLPIRWSLENLKLSRTRNFARPRRSFFHHGPLLQRSEVSLSEELAKPAPKLEKLSRSAGESVLESVREVMFVRYRELYGTTLGDPRTVVRADLGRGVVIHLWGLPATRRLPVRAYVCGYTLKNGVPIHYFEAIGLCEWLEIGFNVFYTYRQGETAWIYAQTLRCLRALTGAKVFSIYPYQIGQDNDEAIDSGAFWFYRKLGFRPGRRDLQQLCEKEENKITANPTYRTTRRTLKRLAEAHMFYHAPNEAGFVSGHAFSRAKRITRSKPALAAESSGPWDTFTTRNLGLLINRRMARKFESDSQKIRQASTASVTQILKIHPARWSPSQKQALENWSLVLALIPELPHWTLTEKNQLIRIIRAKAALNEMLYLHQTQRHGRLREALLRLGS
jgi:hypothetical protein